MQSPFFALSVAVSFVLLQSGLRKMVSISAFSRTVGSLLSTNPTISTVLAWTDCLIEVFSAFLVMWLRTPLGAAAVALPGTTFGLAGGLSLLRRLGVGCNCFGSPSAKLGWPQILAFPVWIVAAALLWISPIEEEYAHVIAPLVATAATLAWVVAPLRREAVGDRFATDTWRPSRRFTRLKLR